MLHLQISFYSVHYSITFLHVLFFQLTVLKVLYHPEQKAEQISFPHLSSTYLNQRCMLQIVYKVLKRFKSEVVCKFSGDISELLKCCGVA